MKVTIEPRKTTWVPFIDSKAKVEMEWDARIEYSQWSLTQNAKPNARMRYIFTGLQDSPFIPPSKLIIKEDGIPLAIVESVVSGGKNRFKSTWIEDPFIEIEDRLASVEKSEVVSKPLSRRVIERRWTETVSRSIRIDNQTNRKVSLQLTLTDQPAQELLFVHSEPTPTSKEAPEYLFQLELDKDARTTIKATFTLKKFEKIELPPEHVKVDGSTLDLDEMNEIEFQQMADEAAFD